LPTAHDGAEVQGARAWLPFGRSLLIASSVLLIGATFAPSCAMSPKLAYAIAFAVVSTELLAAAHWVPAPSLRSAAPVLMLAVVTLIGVRGQAPTPMLAVAVTLALLAGSSVLGSLVGSRIEHPGHLAAVFAISALADLWSVYDPSGPSAKLALQAAAEPERLVLFALPWPMLGSPHIQPVIGAGDILFAALYAAALRRHGLRVWSATLAMGAGLMIGLGLLLQFDRALPLLPLMGAGVMLAVPQARSLPAQDRRSVTTVVVLLAGFLVYRFTR